MTEISRENKMGVMPVGRLLFTMAAPMVISMLVQALYNIVDSIFVSMYDPLLLQAVSLAFPAQNLMIGVASGTAVGINALLSRSLGEKNNALVSKSAGNGLLLAALGSLLFVFFGIFGAEPFLRFQETNAAVVKAGRDYLFYVCTFSVVLFAQITFERLLQSTGRTVYSMISQLSGAIVNIILDPILIFGWLGLPEMGIKGAAIATLIGQTVAASIGAFLHFRYNREIRVSLRDVRPERSVILRIVSVAVPSILMVCIGSVMTVGMNRIFDGSGADGDAATRVFGAYFKLQSFIFMPVFGLNNGLIPIIAYNYGAGKRSRLLRALLYAVLSAVALMLIGLLLMQIIPGPLLGIFSADAAMLRIGRAALRTISLSFVFAGFCIVSSSSFQALGKGFYSTLLSFARQLVVLLPVAYLLSLSGDLSIIWWSFPIAEIVSMTVAALLFLRLYHRTIKKIPDHGSDA